MRLVGFSAAVLLVCASAHSFTTYVRPGMLCDDDSVVILASGALTGGAQIIDSSVTVSEGRVTVSLSIRPCTSDICPPLYQAVIKVFRIGTLEPGSYELVTRVDTVREGHYTSSWSETTSFSVNECTTEAPRLAGFSVMSHGWQDKDASRYYYYINGDTLNVAAVYKDHCCAHFIPDLTRRDDTLEITIEDIGFNLCDCGYPEFVVTTAIAQAITDSRDSDWTVRVTRRSIGGYEPYSRDFCTFVADPAKPGLCIGLQSKSERGVTLYPDSTWCEYDLVLPLVEYVSLLRLQPNPEHEAYDPDNLYADNFVFGTFPLDDFGSSSLCALQRWNVERFRDCSGLEVEALRFDTNCVLEMEYSNTCSGHCSNYMWKTMAPGVEHGDWDEAGRVLTLSASLIDPAVGPTPVVDRPETRRKGALVRRSPSGVTVLLNTSVPGPLGVRVYDCAGAMICSSTRMIRRPGNYTVEFQTQDNTSQALTSGLHIMRIVSPNGDVCTVPLTQVR